MKYGRQEVSKVWHCWNQMDVYLNQMLTVITQAKGNYLFDQDGNQYLDANSSLWNVNIGHGHPEVISAITNQLHKLDHASLFLSSNCPSVDLAQKLFALTQHRYQHVFYTNSGSEATDTALKIVRQYFFNQNNPKRYKVISLKNAYHGSTFGALSACGIEDDRRAFGPLLEGFYQVETPDPFFKPKEMTLDDWIEHCFQKLITLVEREGPDTIAAIITEPVQGSEGIGVIPDLYWYKLRRFCDQNGIIWISDEIATGFGRTGKMFAAEYTDCWPELMLVAKGITSGYIPLGAVLVTKPIFKSFLGPLEAKREFMHGFTTSGHPVACAAAIANINVIEKEGLVENAELVGKYFLQRLVTIKQFEFVTDVQGKGLLLGFRLSERLREIPGMKNWPPAMIVSKLLSKQGILVHPAGSHAVVMAPVLTFSKVECDQVVEKLMYTFGIISKLLNI